MRTETVVAVDNFRRFLGLEELELEEDLAVFEQEGHIVRPYFEDGARAFLATES